MDQHEIELIEQLAPTNPELKTLWDEHMLYEKQVAKLESKPFLSPQEEQEMRQLKKQKLDGKTKLHVLLDKLR